MAGCLNHSDEHNMLEFNNAALWFNGESFVENIKNASWKNVMTHSRLKISESCINNIAYKYYKFVGNTGLFSIKYMFACEILIHIHIY